MTTPGADDDDHPPTNPPDPLDPHPSGTVAGPRFGDGGTGEFSPGYDATVHPDPHARPPGAPTAGGPPPPASASPPPNSPPPPPPDSARPPTPLSTASASIAADGRGANRAWIAPVIAAVVLLGGVGVLVLGRGSDGGPEPVTTALIAEANDPDDPIVETTVPFVTSPPLLEPTTTITTDSTTTIATTTTSTTTTSTTTTVAPAAGGPTQVQLDNALLGIGDIGDGAWLEQVPEPDDDLCGTAPDAVEPDARADSLFQEIVGEPIGVRQVSNSLFTYATPEIAEQAFTADVDLLVSCNATTVEVEGTQYRVEVDDDSFTAEESVDFPCADQSAFLVTQLVNDQAAVPYIAQSAVAFRCGRNITLTTLTTTLAIDDLSDDDFFDAAGLSNIRVGELAGS